MKIGLYAGSFDPWSFGHKYILEHALNIFDAIHVIVAVNPSKQSILDATTRTRLIANAINPFCNWWKLNPPFLIKKHITVCTHDGLIADYAKTHGIHHLIRGLRSTTDFESEFNLYFANHAIDPSLQTWAIMCPPMLLHCSSTYIKAVVGKKGHKFVGTSFTAQAFMLNQPHLIGQLYDMASARASQKMSEIEVEKSNSELQLDFSNLMQKKITISSMHLKQIQNKLDKSLVEEKKSEFYFGLLKELIKK